MTVCSMDSFIGYLADESIGRNFTVAILGTLNRLLMAAFLSPRITLHSSA